VYKYTVTDGDTLNTLLIVHNINDLTNATQLVITVGSNGITTGQHFTQTPKYVYSLFVTTLIFTGD